MDRDIPEKEIRRERLRRWSIGGAAVIGIAAILIAGARIMRPSIEYSDLRLGTVDIGNIETTINASGRIVPAFEEIINSPISTRIIEVYCTAGDSVEAGTPLLRLDLEAAETQMRRLNDERSLRIADKEKAEAANRTAVNNLKMQIKVKEMTVEKLREDIANEQRLDSIGSGTGERIRQAQLAYKTAQLELEQLKQQLINQQSVQQADMLTQDLNINIATGNITEMQRTLLDAQVKSPRRATLTYIINEIGRRVNEGEKVAVIADLEHFKMEGQISDSHADKFGVGSKAIVQVGKNRFDGTVTNIEPQSQGGIIKFTVALDDDDNPTLRSGQTTQAYILTDIKEDAVRLPSGTYYNGPGKYTLFVKDGNELRRREVQLGDANYDYVEVISGLKSGETVVTSDLKKDNKTITINNNKE